MIVFLITTALWVAWVASDSDNTSPHWAKVVGAMLLGAGLAALLR